MSSPNETNAFAKLRTLAVQACDGCRARKTRCLRNSNDERCERCTHARLACTFDKPFKTRGPKKRFVDGGQELNVTTAQSFPVSPAVSEDPFVSASQPSSTTEQHSELGSLSGDFHPHDGYALTAALTADEHQHASHPTDFICPRSLLLRILEHYLTWLYPLIPVVHRPSFSRDVASGRDAHDMDFLGLEIALCAAVVGTMPSKFASYQLEQPTWPFESRKSFLHTCYGKVLDLRGQGYFDEINYNKWATSYLMSVAFFQIGEHNQARMIDVECMQLGRLLHLHRVSEYEGLNCIETQLRKKGFWLLFYAYMYAPAALMIVGKGNPLTTRVRHSQVQSLRKERLNYLDKEILHTLDLEHLLPLDVDDEYIDEDTVLQPPNPGPCLTSGFITHSQVFWAAIQDIEPLDNPTLPPQAAHLQARIERLKYMLDNVAPELRPWAASYAGSDDAPSRFAAMRANIHVTHLWLQSILMDQLEVMLNRPPEYQRKLWQDREELSRQLLHILHHIPQADIEPNGLHLAYKVRDIAVGLFACPFDPHEQASQRAAIYVQEFTRILSRLDASETMNTTNLQTWVDTDRVKGPVTLGTAIALRNKSMVWP